MRWKQAHTRVLTVFGLVLFLTAGAAISMPAADLTVDGTTVMLHGELSFSQVLVLNGGKILVTPYDGSAGTGMLKLKARRIFIDASSSIDAGHAGYRALLNANGEGPGGGTGGAATYDSGGGGAYGGNGGDGVRDYSSTLIDGLGGSPYGNTDAMTIAMGSAGGAAGSRDGDYGGYGGNGGGAIELRARKIEILGSVTANGQDGLIYVNDSSGGGAGGGILIVGETIILSGSHLDANGGNGGTACGVTPCSLDDGGGGGSGGRIKIFYRYLTGEDTDNISTLGGNGALNGRDGEAGTYTKNKIPIGATVVIQPEPLCINGDYSNITVYIELPPGYDVQDILPTSVRLNKTAEAEPNSAQLGDYDNDNIPDVMFQFPFSEVAPLLRPGNPARILITGELATGVVFKSFDKIEVIADCGN